jgi:predicted unusual protein kinase regulating ubiquinone biosynthesis (AarF/ABC1/UbiB family)
MTDGAAGRIDALIQIALRLARSAPSGRIALAQLARSLDPAWIPLPWGETILAELESARDDACVPLEFKVVERILRDAWGAPHTEELDGLDPTPVAITPTAQVHRGVHEGRDVAVKVLRPGVAGSVRQDLSLLEGLIGPLATAFPSLDPGALMAEVRERVLDELDLEHEAAAQRWFHRALRRHPLFSVPAPVTQLSHENVLVSEWVTGVPLGDAAERDAAASRLVLFVLGGLRAGMVHADIDPDDVLVLDDGRLAILDFGATRAVDAARAEQTAAAVEAFVAADAQSLGEALGRLEWLAPEHAEAALELGEHVLAELAGTDAVRLDTGAVLAAGERAAERPRQLLELMLAGALLPEDLWPARAVGALFGTIARVGATAPWRELTRLALREGWDARLPDPGR